MEKQGRREVAQRSAKDRKLLEKAIKSQANARLGGLTMQNRRWPYSL
ncbi:MAG: hypothetical protein NTY87_10205 [Planctomycetia bacterium]|nr:hypothetical protein [Planctomycetia bacterium]